MVAPEPHLSREAGSGAAGHVAPCLDLKFIRGVPGLQGTNMDGLYSSPILGLGYWTMQKWSTGTHSHPHCVFLPAQSLHFI
jgi:hypothetical protein